MGAIAGIFGTIQLQAIARNDNNTIPIEQLQEFRMALGHIKAYYVEPTDNAKLMEDAISGMVSGLDPHSQYLNAEDYKDFVDSTTGKFVGLGIEIIQEDGLVKIVAPIEDTPAYRAGLMPNDLITRIDDTDVRDLTLQQAVQRMRGEPNTSVKLTIFRKSESRTFTVTIVRAEVHTRSVKADMVEPGYAWIRVSQFQENTVDSFVQKINALYKKDPQIKGIVLDLRNDPGGLLDSAVAISSAFLPENALIVSTRGQNKDVELYYLANPQYYASKGRSPQTIIGTDADGNTVYRPAVTLNISDPLAKLPAALKTVPLVVLVNEGSASASEIVAGALKDHGRATIMGATTFGKGSVQSTLMVAENSAIKITIALYYTPSNQSIQATGIVPDILLAEFEDGSSPLSALYTREADLQRHIVVNDEDKDAANKLKQERDKLMESLQNDENALPRMPEYGGKEDFRLQQALNYLQGKPVISLDPKADNTAKGTAEEKPAPAQQAPAQPATETPLIRERVLEP